MAKNDLTTWIREKVTAEVVIAFVLGVVLGLVVLGWWLWPVQWTNADPADLKAGYKESYLQMIADAYALTGNTEVAGTRLEALKGAGEEDVDISAMLNDLVKARIAAGNADAAIRLQGLFLAMVLPPPPTPEEAPGELGATGWIWAGALGQATRFAGIVFFVVVLGVGTVLLLKQLQKRESLRRGRPPLAREASAGVLRREREVTAPPLPESTLGHFVTTYNVGDESYDVSYSIESPTGEFLGECGMSALESVGIGERETVGAFEVWLFDKDDVRTETKVLMSERAFRDGAMRDELATKGESVQAGEGQIVTLETANLRLDARIIELAYESGSDSGIFAGLTTRLEVSLR